MSFTDSERKAYADFFIGTLRFLRSVDALNDVWKSQAANRDKLGITEGSEWWNVMVQACADRKKALAGG